MKTTVEMPDALYNEVRSWAAENGWTLKVVLEESLRQFLDSRGNGRSSAAPSWRPVIYGGEGLQTPGMTFSEMLSLSERPFPDQDRRGEK